MLFISVPQVKQLAGLGKGSDIESLVLESRNSIGELLVTVWNKAGVAAQYTIEPDGTTSEVWLGNV